MINIKDTATFYRAMESPLDPALKHLLILRYNQLLSGTNCELADLAQFLAMEPFDSVAEIEAAAGYPVITSPAFEWVIDHGGVLEAPVILEDSGFGVVLFVPQAVGIDATVLSLLRDQLRQS